jgi:ribosomal protein S18 acetylase RimI-like enzyme
MLEPSARLGPRALEAIGALERRVVEADGGRLKLEWDTLVNRAGDHVEDLLWWEDDELVGYLGLYAFESPLEVTGMVDPRVRRRGIATKLLTAAMTLGAQRNQGSVLLVVPGTSVGGRALALRHGGTFTRSEHAMELVGEPVTGTDDPHFRLRRAGPADTASVAALLQSGLSGPAPDLADRLASSRERTWLIEADGQAVGTIRLTRTAEVGGVYGFVIAPAWRGQGLGRDVLRRVCRQLRAEGATRIGLDVAVDNDRALGLYTSLGFTPIASEDYYAVPVPVADTGDSTDRPTPGGRPTDT